MPSTSADSRTERPMPDGGEGREAYHVLLASGEQLLLTWDKVLDCLRLEVIDEQSLVWKPGMTQWQRLLDVVEVESRPPPPSSRIRNSVPPSPASQGSFAIDDVTTQMPRPMSTSSGGAFDELTPHMAPRLSDWERSADLDKLAAMVTRASKPQPGHAPDASIYEESDVTRVDVPSPVEQRLTPRPQTVNVSSEWLSRRPRRRVVPDAMRDDSAVLPPAIPDEPLQQPDRSSGSIPVTSHDLETPRSSDGVRRGWLQASLVWGGIAVAVVVTLGNTDWLPVDLGRLKVFATTVKAEPEASCGASDATPGTVGGEGMGESTPTASASVASASVATAAAATGRENSSVVDLNELPVEAKNTKGATEARNRIRHKQARSRLAKRAAARAKVRKVKPKARKLRPNPAPAPTAVALVAEVEDVHSVPAGESAKPGAEPTMAAKAAPARDAEIEDDALVQEMRDAVKRSERKNQAPKPRPKPSAPQQRDDDGSEFDPLNGEL